MRWQTYSFQMLSNRRGVDQTDEQRVLVAAMAVARCDTQAEYRVYSQGNSMKLALLVMAVMVVMLYVMLVFALVPGGCLMLAMLPYWCCCGGVGDWSMLLVVL